MSNWIYSIVIYVIKLKGNVFRLVAALFKQIPIILFIAINCAIRKPTTFQFSSFKRISFSLQSFWLQMKVDKQNKKHQKYLFRFATFSKFNLAAFFLWESRGIETKQLIPEWKHHYWSRDSSKCSLHQKWSLSQSGLNWKLWIVII